MLPLAFGLGLVAPRGSLADRLEKFFLLLLQGFLAGAGGLFLGGSRGLRSAATSAASAKAAFEAYRRRGLRRAGGANVGHLLQVAGVERHDVQIAAAREVDALAIGQKMRVGLGFAGVGELADLAVGRVIEEQVAIARVNGEPPVARNVADRQAAPVSPPPRSACAGGEPSRPTT